MGSRLGLDASLKLMTGSLSQVPLPPIVDPATPPSTPKPIFSENNGMKDLWMAVTRPK